MNDQIEQVWRCKDGKGGFVTGSKEEVEAYLKSKNPLGGMGFPYQVWSDGVIARYDQRSVEWEKEERKAIVAFANLAPKIDPLYRRWQGEVGSNWREQHYINGSSSQFTQWLLLAYEEALKQVPQ